MVVIFLLMPNSTLKKDNFLLIFFKRRNRKHQKELLSKLQIRAIVDALEVVDLVVVMVMGVEERQVEVPMQVLQVPRRNASAPQQFGSTSTHSRRSTITIILNT
ncbi:hypothetical protein L484_003634 [Morus notabilis]|uniref:Uncharacterized protein n=1 Tax=Morus notabilis TaxID=981085 RepID=W9R3K9_9ROSA|nr:hypothetical protein L484_003634 [Morus notabilis]